MKADELMKERLRPLLPVVRVLGASLALFIAPMRVPMIPSAGALNAQEVYTNLKQPEHIRIFNKVSNSVICQCGCHFILSSCPHVECPWGIPIRRFMENRIREGMGAEEIIYHLEHGFGNNYMDDPVVVELLDQGRTDLVQKIVEGHGPSIRGTTANWIPILLIAIFVIAGLLIAIRYFRKRDPFGDLSPPDADNHSGADDAGSTGTRDGTNSDGSGSGDTDSDDVDLDRFKDIDR
ncbi:MAG: hypothetical protein KDK25_12475 [Leptospiraceae bacterium]|nr:hypothetical protein [Leptospiraceae bacterium]